MHGYGGDGKDISTLTHNWKRFLPNTVFLCPDGHETCPINPNGFQWFDLSKDDPKYIIEQSLKGEQVIQKFINEVKELFTYADLDYEVTDHNIEVVKNYIYSGNQLLDNGGVVGEGRKRLEL